MSDYPRWLNQIMYRTALVIAFLLAAAWVVARIEDWVHP
jgi:hypothetical protein